MACNIKRLKTQCNEGRACLHCGSAYMQTHVHTHTLHTHTLHAHIVSGAIDIWFHI